MKTRLDELTESDWIIFRLLMRLTRVQQSPRWVDTKEFLWFSRWYANDVSHDLRLLMVHMWCLSEGEVDEGAEPMTAEDLRP